MNLDQLFQESAARHPNHPAIIKVAGERLSYAELDQRIEQIAGELQQRGVTTGITVGLHCDSGLDYIVLTYAIWRCGACVVPIPIELAPVEKQRILQYIHLHQLLSSETTAGFAGEFTSNITPPLSSGQSLWKINSPCEEPAGLSSLNSSFIRFTSGTTGDSKGVVLTHESIRDRIHAANDALKLSSEDRVIWLLSMSYHFAVSIVSYLTYGCTIILPENLFAKAILQAITSYQATFIYGSPLQYSWMTSCKPAPHLSSLRLAISTTSPLEESLGKEFEQHFGLPLTQALGIIEVGLPCINIDFASSKPNAIGRVLPAYELRLRPTELDSTDLEILLRGPGFVDAYYHPWRLRDDIMPDGWFATGDICSVDDEGCLTIRGRSKDVINISGMKFFPREVESVLREHPAIRKARVFSVEYPRRGELAEAEVIAEFGVEPLPTQAELIVWCQEKLAPYKVPVRIEYVESFPKTASGKVLHRKL